MYEPPYYYYPQQQQQQPCYWGSQNEPYWGNSRPHPVPYWTASTQPLLSPADTLKDLLPKGDKAKPRRPVASKKSKPVVHDPLNDCLMEARQYLASLSYGDLMAELPKWGVVDISGRTVACLVEAALSQVVAHPVLVDSQAQSAHIHSVESLSTVVSAQCVEASAESSTVVCSPLDAFTECIDASVDVSSTAPSDASTQCVDASVDSSFTAPSPPAKASTQCVDASVDASSTAPFPHVDASTQCMDTWYDKYISRSAQIRSMFPNISNGLLAIALIIHEKDDDALIRNAIKSKRPSKKKASAVLPVLRESLGVAESDTGFESLRVAESSDADNALKRFEVVPVAESTNDEIVLKGSDVIESETVSIEAPENTESLDELEPQTLVPAMFVSQEPVNAEPTKSKKKVIQFVTVKNGKPSKLVLPVVQMAVKEICKSRKSIAPQMSLKSGVKSIQHAESHKSGKSKSLEPVKLVASPKSGKYIKTIKLANPAKSVNLDTAKLAYSVGRTRSVSKSSKAVTKLVEIKTAKPTKPVKPITSKPAISKARPRRSSRLAVNRRK